MNWAFEYQSRIYKPRRFGHHYACKYLTGLGHDKEQCPQEVKYIVINVSLAIGDFVSPLRPDGVIK